MDLLRPSLEEGFVIQQHDVVVLDFIGWRGSARDVTKDGLVDSEYYKYSTMFFLVDPEDCQLCDSNSNIKTRKWHADQ